MAEKEIKVSIKVTGTDLYCFMLQHTYRSFGGIVSLVFSLGSFGLLLYSWSTVDLPYKVILIICSLLFTVIDPLMLYVRAVKQAAVKPGFKSPIDYVFTPNGFTMSQGGETAAAKWGDLWKIRDSKNYIFLYGNRIRANIVPKRQIGEQAGTVSGWIREYQKKV